MEHRQQPQGANVNVDGRGRPLDGETTAVNEAELLQNMATEGVLGKKGEIDDYMATAFLSKEEIYILREMQKELSRLRMIAKKLGLDEETWKQSRARKEIRREMVTLAQTSKSKGGAAFKWARSEVLHKTEDLYQESAVSEDKTFLDKLLEKAEESETQVMGGPQVGTYKKDPGEGF